MSGSARVHASGAVGGVLSLTSPGLGVAGVGASIPSDGFIAPVTRSATESSSTGVAIASTGLPVKVILTLRDEKGKPVSGGGATLELSANGHLARYLERRIFQMVILCGAIAFLLTIAFWLKPEPIDSEGMETRVLAVLDRLLMKTRFAQYPLLPVIPLQ